LIAEEKRMYSRVSKTLSRVLTLAAVALLPVAMVAQDSAKPAAKAPAGDSVSKWDIFAGYSYLAPKGTVQVLQGDGVTVLPVSYDAANYGVIGSGAYYFNKYVGAELNGASHAQWTNGTSSNDGFLSVNTGLIMRYPTTEITPFIHGLVGAMDVDGPEHEARKWGMALTVGGGLDYSTPLLNHHLGVRLFQLDYVYSHVDFGPGIWQGRANINSTQLSAGLVYHIGGFTPPPPVTLACSSSASSIFPGEPVTVTATAGALNPKDNVLYSWSGTGVTGKGTTANVDTAALAPGSYTVKATVKEGKAGKEGLKPGESAECSASFTVKDYEPPTISCSAIPSTIKPGDMAAVKATAMSPQNRPLTYSYTASAGTVSGSGNSASYNSTGAPTGAVGINCNVVDDKGHTATASTSVTIVAPYIPPPPHTQALCSISFDKDKVRPTRVDNEAKACLDDVALSLQKQPDAKVVVVGESDSKEKAKEAKAEKIEAKKKHPKPVAEAASERAVNTKEYLVTDKGIDASRISVATSAADGQKVEDYLVPAGATFSADVTGTTPVNEMAVKPQVRKPLTEKKHHKKAAK
jgi:outer membrane protein OmpA-like peptidoglycan-associated protein